MRRRTKIFGTALAALILVSFIAYSAAWLFFAGIVKQTIAENLQNARMQGFEITGAPPQIGGYPALFTVSYSGAISGKDGTIIIPKLTARSIFLNGFPLTMNLPQGATINSPQVPPDLQKITYAKARIIIPNTVPRTDKPEDLYAWLATPDAQLVIENLTLRLSGIEILAEGTFRPDENLQPAGQMKIRINNPQNLLPLIKSVTKLKGQELMLAGFALSGLTRTDAETQQTYIETNLTLRNQTLYLGPLALARFPALVYQSQGKHTPPALLQ